MENKEGIESIMKLRRALSGILFGVGCAMTFVGLLALILPAIANEQLQLVLASFLLPSQHLLVSAVNRCMSFALENGWRVLLCGAALLAVGVTLFSRYTADEPVSKTESYRRPVQQPPLWEAPPAEANGPNPFADTTLWEQYAPKIQAPTPSETPAIGFVSPLLEPNRIEEEAPAAAPETLYARPVPASEPEPLADAEIPAAEALPAMPEDEPAPSAEAPDPSAAPVQLSPRIRSTMGKRREW